MRSRDFIPAIVLLAFLPVAFAQTQLIQDGYFNATSYNQWWGWTGSGIAFNSGYLSMGNAYGVQGAVYQTVTFPANLIAATLSLEYGSTSTSPSGNDTLSFYISNTNQTSFTLLRTVSGANPTGKYVAYTTNLATYTTANTLSSYAGQTVDVYFYVTDYGSSTAFYITDVSLLAATTANIPPNDDFANATQILTSAFTNDVTTTYASKEPGEPNHAGNAGGHSVWWTWTAPAIGTVSIKTTGTNFKTLLGVYTGSSVSDLTVVASDNGSTHSTGKAAVTFVVPTQAQVGTQYYIALDGYNGQSGSNVFTFNFARDTTPPTVAFSSPSAGAAATNSSALVKGTANDNVAVASVEYHLSNASGTNAWQSAATSNQWTNWSATITNLIPGTNLVTVAAFDTSTNMSTPVSLLLDYDIPIPLTLATNGRGAISGATNGQLLDLNFPYKITAVPAAGFGFAGWTGSIVTNTTNLSFIMATNLSFTANFVQTQKPTLTITAPTSGQRCSNSLFQIAGKASNVVAVASVYYQLDGGGWSNALSTNGFTNWTAAVTLTPGTNTVRAYAVDTSGLVSTNTNTIIFFYVLTAPLVLQTNGRGTISPDYNNQSLALMSNYSMTAAATPGSGFAFTNWTGGTNPPLAILTNKPKLTFTMASNLTLIANFVDTNPPSLTITSPTANQRWSNNTITVTGTAKDNVQVSNVFYQFNGGSWTPATPGNAAWTNWTASPAPLESSNMFKAYAVDTSGNISLTNKVSFLYIPSAALTVQTNGLGGITPAVNGKSLAIGTNYTLTAAAGHNWLFSNWIGGTALPYSVLSTSSNYTFPMQSNLFLEANFVTNFFNAAQGAYCGLFAPANALREQTNSGSFAFNLLNTGTFSGHLYLGSNTVSLSGKFDVSGFVQTNSAVKGGKPLTTRLQLDVANQAVSGSVSDGSFVAPLDGDRNVFGPNHPATDYAGQYTWIIAGTNDAFFGPYGTSYGTLTVSNSGGLSLAGNLADGTTVSQSSAVSKDGRWPMYLPSSNPNESVFGWNYFSNQTLMAPSLVSWINVTNKARAALYPPGFTNPGASLAASLYTATNKPLLDLAGAQVIVEGGGLPFAITNQIGWASNNTITAPTNIPGNTNRLKLTITATGAKTGLITGSFANPTNKNQTITINGVLLQNQTNAQGYFPGTNASGTFLLGTP